MFVKSGWICIRYDKRGTHESTGNNKTSGLTQVHYQGHSIKEVHSSLGKVWPDGITPTPTGATSVITYYSSSKLNVNLNYFIPKATAETFTNGVGTIEFNSDVTVIDSQAFYSKTAMTIVIIPNSVTYIGNNAFRNCSGLTSIDIPSSVTNIGVETFANCTSLTSITIEATTPPWLINGSYTFGNTNNCPIYVPEESVDTYKSANGWSIIASRIYAIQ